MSRPRVAFMVSLYFVAATNGLCREGGDHLAALDTTQFANYRRILLSHVTGTPFDCGRVVVCPAFEPEYSISIYQSDGNPSAPTYRVAYFTAKKTIWGLTNGGNDITETNAIKVQRKEVDFPRSTALLLRRVWAKMLAQARGQTPPAGKWDRIPIDSTNIEWYLQRRNGRVSTGKLNNYFSIGPNTQSFITLTKDALLRYRDADAQQRAVVAKSIEADAQKLLSKIQ